jgi:hypothetical protein
MVAVPGLTEVARSVLPPANLRRRIVRLLSG